MGPPPSKGKGPVLWRRMPWPERVITGQHEPMAKAGLTFRGSAAQAALSLCLFGGCAGQSIQRLGVAHA